MTATDRARFFAGEYPRTDRQRVDTLLDELAWQRHLTRTCQHVIDQLRDQNAALAMAVARLEGHRDPNLARRNHLGEQ